MAGGADNSGEPAELRLGLEPERFIGSGQPHYAVIDIGSNSVRLMVYDQLGRAPFPRFNEKSLCRLGAGLDETGALSAEAVAHTLRAIDRFCSIARAMDVARIDVLATEAVRRAANGGELIAAIRARNALTPRILTGEEEARFSALGVLSGFYRPNGLVGDLGGGSLEVAEILDDRVGERWASLPLGALPVGAMMERGFAAARKTIDEMLAERLPPLMTEPVFYAVGGGWRALARIHIAMHGGPVRVVQGLELEAREVQALAKKIAHASPDEVAALPGVPARRVQTLPAAALTLHRVLRQLRPERVVFSALGLREGWLYSQLAPEDRDRDALIDGAQAFGAPRARVPDFAAALVRWTDGLFPGEAAADRRLRVAACAVSDIAWRDHVDVRAEECFHRLLQFPLVGITHAERVFIAATVHARYGGSADDPAVSAAARLLGPAQRRRARILGRALQFAYRISGSVPEILDPMKLVIEADRVCVDIVSTETVPDSDAVRSRLKRLAQEIGVRRTKIRNRAGDRADR